MNGVQEEWDSASTIEDPGGTTPGIYFQRLETPKTGKNRVHIDINASTQGSREKRVTQMRAEVQQIEKLRGAMQRESYDDLGFWIVMLDPEGNELRVK